MWWLWAYECIFQQKKKKNGPYMTFCDMALEVTSACPVGQSCQKVHFGNSSGENRPHTLVMVTGMGGDVKEFRHSLFTLKKNF